MLLQSIPKAFTCASCNLHTWKSVCASCKETLQWNSELLPSPVSEIEALAPLLFSYSRTQGLIRQFKEYGGNDLRKTLFKMPMGLKHRLMETHFFAIVPIPQQVDRSYVRGHESAMETAYYFARQLSLPVLPLLKLKDRNTARLTSRSKFEREWAENPFEVLDSEELLKISIYPLLQEKLSNGKEIRLLLVDDLITSGSTLAKASESLKELSPQNLKVWGGGIGFRPHRVMLS